MENNFEIRKTLRPRIGLYTAGLKAYWTQFEGLRDRITAYGKFIESRLSENTEVFNFGLVDDETTGRAAGEYFNAVNADIIFSHSGTYYTSSSVLPVHQLCKAKTIILNLQPGIKMNYHKTGTGEWLAHCVACPVPEICNAFNRAGIEYHVINGLLGLEETPAISVTDEASSQCPEAIRAWQKINTWVNAAAVKRTLQYARFGFLGNNYSGMLDMYSDFTMLQAQTGIHVEILEMCDLERSLRQVTEQDIQGMTSSINEFFAISGDSPSDPIAKKPTEQQLYWAAKVACAQEKMVLEYRLDSLSYYYHGSNDNSYERLQSGFIVGHSLLTAKGVPCAGEGDIKTAIAMKICSILGKGGSFCEIVATDYALGTIIMGHDGPFHIFISDGKPVLRGMGVYHGKKGSGVSVEAHVSAGDITLLGITQTINGKLKMIISEAEAVQTEILTIGNTQTHVKFSVPPDDYMDKWFVESPTHHFAMSVGRNKDLFAKTAELLNMEYVII